MKNTSCIIKFICLSSAIVLLTACHSSRSASRGVSAEMRQLVHAGIQLGFDIEEDDPHALYVESAAWLGTPYRFGGNTTAGIDCSGLTCQIYQRVYGKQLQRNSRKQYEVNCKHVNRKNLLPGDLVFFGSGGKASNINHTGIYLKRNLFIHASSSRGVMVSSLDERYWRQRWVGGGRVK